TLYTYRKYTRPLQVKPSEITFFEPAWNEQLTCCETQISKYLKSAVNLDFWQLHTLLRFSRNTMVTPHRIFGVGDSIKSVINNCQSCLHDRYCLFIQSMA